MDPNAPASNQLPLSPTPGAGDQAEPSSPAAAAEKAAAEKAAAEKAAAENAAAEKAAAEKAAAENAAPKRTERTAARAPKKGAAARTGARARRSSAAADGEPVEIKRVPMIMQTSRISDVNGRAVARRRLALVADSRVEHLHDRGYARAATKEEVEAAKAAGQAVPLID